MKQNIQWETQTTEQTYKSQIPTAGRLRVHGSRQRSRRGRESGPRPPARPPAAWPWVGEGGAAWRLAERQVPSGGAM